MSPTVIACSKAFPVRPSRSVIFPSSGRPAFLSCSLIAASFAPSKTGVATCIPSACAAQPRCVSRIWPMFIRLGTPSGLSTMSTGVPSGRNGMSSTGRILAMTPLVPWRLGLVLLYVDRRELVVLDDAVAKDDGVLVVAALPGHEGDEDVLAERELALVGRVAVGEDLVGLHAVADRDEGPLVEARSLVGADELLQAVAEGVARVLLDPDLRRTDRANDARRPRDDDLSRVTRGAVLDPSPDERSLRAHDRDGLTLHVRAHEGAVGVVVLQERYERGGDGHDLLRRHVHVIGRRRRGLVVFVATVHLDALVEEEATLVETRVRLHDRRELLFVGGQVHDLVGDARLSFGVAFSGSTIDMRSRTTRSMRSRPTRNWLWMSSPTARTRRLPR